MDNGRGSAFEPFRDSDSIRSFLRCGLREVSAPQARKLAIPTKHPLLPYIVQAKAPAEEADGSKALSPPGRASLLGRQRHAGDAKAFGQAAKRNILADSASAPTLPSIVPTPAQQPSRGHRFHSTSPSRVGHDSTQNSPACSRHPDAAGRGRDPAQPLPGAKLEQRRQRRLAAGASLAQASACSSPTAAATHPLPKQMSTSRSPSAEPHRGTMSGATAGGRGALLALSARKVGGDAGKRKNGILEKRLIPRFVNPIWIPGEDEEVTQEENKTPLAPFPTRSRPSHSNAALPLEELRALADELGPVAALRNALLFTFGTMEAVFEQLDPGDEGEKRRITVNDIGQVCNILGASCRVICGVDEAHLLRSLESDDTVSASLVDLLGCYPETAVQRDDLGATDRHWRRYVNETADGAQAVGRKPRWEAHVEPSPSDTMDKRDLRRAVKDPSLREQLMHRLLPGGGSSPEHVTTNRHKADHYKEHQRQVRLRAVLQDMSASRQKVKEMRESLQVLQERPEQKVEIILKQKEKEAAKVGAALHQGLLGTQRRVLDKYSAPEQIIIPDREVLNRDLAKKSNLSVLDVDRIWTVFSAATRGGRVSRAAFPSLLQRFLPSVEIGPSQLSMWWRDLDQDRSGDASFEEFTVWYLTSVLPKMAGQHRGNRRSLPSGP
mmetsp:Transcript_40342/g.90668  ORF Transcript_40342/g.90668 Transcript_40342/m.90668 type:complete len:666 (-) Transcript_40342:70-2067(-)